MHNRKKLEQPLGEAEQTALRKKSDTYRELVKIIFHRKAEKIHTAETLELIYKMLRNNPDFYTLWNFRREILFTIYPGLEHSTHLNRFNAESSDQLRDQELAVSEEGIRRNPKSYGAWHHRLWIIQRFQVDTEKELSLCRDFLKEDQRNFHCWNYRRFVVDALLVPHAREFEFSTEKIMDNFSNYSAFHHRSNFLRSIDQPLHELLPQEFAHIENAVFTEPDDQSAWWYHQFLLRYIRTRIDELTAQDHAVEADELRSWFIQTLSSQRLTVQSLLELEETSKWAMNCLLTIIDQLVQCMQQEQPQSTAEARVAETELLSERLQLLGRLTQVDELHTRRYAYLMRQSKQ